MGRYNSLQDSQCTIHLRTNHDQYHNQYREHPFEMAFDQYQKALHLCYRVV